jgi:hypothetical protein
VRVVGMVESISGWCSNTGKRRFIDGDYFPNSFRASLASGIHN